MFLAAKSQKQISLTYCLSVAITSVVILVGTSLEVSGASKFNESEPYVLNFALPRLLVSLNQKSGKTKSEDMEKTIRHLFHELYCPGGRCLKNRGVQINIALGNDYQILDWLGKGWVEGALVPTLSLYLLKRDGVDLLEIDPKGGSRWPISDLPQEASGSSYDLEKFWKWIWERAQKAEKEKLTVTTEKDACQLAMSSHLSTGSFVAPIAATGEWLENQPARDQMANRFWREFFDHVRFTFDADQRNPIGHKVDCTPVILRKERPARSVRELLKSSEYHLVIASPTFSTGGVTELKSE